MSSISIPYNDTTTHDVFSILLTFDDIPDIIEQIGCEFSYVEPNPIAIDADVLASVLNGFDCSISYSADPSSYYDDELGCLTVNYAFHVEITFKSQEDMEAAEQSLPFLA